MNEPSSDLVESFRQEAGELLVQLEVSLLDLERAPRDSELVDAAFRSLHTIKGAGGMFGFDELASFAHHVETAFDQVRMAKLAPTRELIALALRAKDYMRALIERPETADAATGRDILSALNRLQATSAPAPFPAAQATAEAEPKLWRIRFRFRSGVLSGGVNPLPVLNELRTLGAAAITPPVEDLPPQGEIDPAKLPADWEVLLSTSAPRSTIEDIFIFVQDDVELEIAEASEKDPAEQRFPDSDGADGASPIKDEAENTALGRASPSPVRAPACSGAHTPDEGKSEHSQAGKLHHHKNSGHNESDKGATQNRTAAHAAGSIRVATERLDELMNRVGELVIAQSRLRQIAATSNDQQVKSVAEEIERLVLELRDTSMGVRMVPIGSLFGRFRRVVHDLSDSLSKEVELVMEGEETELDKTVIEQLNDPLVHLVRNAIDHGLERPEGRKAAGKPQTGRITLSARHAGTEVLITVADDGRGLDRERIRDCARKLGMLAPDAQAGDAELFQLLFQPGFSTMTEVTNLSGRGVGMDVVKRTVEALRGKIDVASPAGRGAVVTLRLPLTLAIIDGLMVRVGNGRYVLPLETIVECVELSAEEDARSRGRSLLNIRGELVPFLRLRELFGARTQPDRYQKVVIVSFADLKVGLVVDQVVGQHQTVIKSLSRLHADIEMFSGATILGDGSVALILDIPHLVEFGQIKEEHMKVAS